MRSGIGLLAALVLAAAPAAVSADSFTPIRMTVTIAPVARLHQPLKIKVSVNADAGALDIRDGPVRAQVKLTTSECGGVFNYTTGTTLLNKALSPQPATGQPYQGSATGSGRPASYGVQSVCVYLDDNYQQFDTDTTDYQVNVSKHCTQAAAAYDKARDRRRKPHNLSKLKRSARSACGSGVPL